MEEPKQRLDAVAVGSGRQAATRRTQRDVDGTNVRTRRQQVDLSAR
jgi:hypothetical protein